MNNDDVYAEGLLNSALDPRTQPPAIRDFLSAEAELVRTLVPLGGRVVDIGCGTGRHLIAMKDDVSQGVGVDYEKAYIAEAIRQRPNRRLQFLVGDATAVPLDADFDRAVCLTNTWGTMADKMAVVDEMKRLAPAEGARILSVYAPPSIPARKEWYRNLGHDIDSVTEERVVTKGGFITEHFTEERLRGLIGPCKIQPIGKIAFVAQY